MNIRQSVAGIAAAGAVMVGGLAMGSSMASAQEPTPEATPTHRAAARADFLSHLATELNQTMDQLKTALKNAQLQTVDDLTTDGTLTSDQAAKLKERIESSQGAGLRAFFRRNARRAEVLRAVRRGIVKSAAGAIGIDPKDLATELRGGKSIAEVAGEHNVSVDAVKAAITDAATQALDKARENGRIDQTREDAALQRLADRLDTIVNKTAEQPGT